MEGGVDGNPHLESIQGKTTRREERKAPNRGFLFHRPGSRIEASVERAVSEQEGR